MRRLLWRLFPPAEVTATRGHMREFLRRVSPTYPLPRELERRAIALTRDAEYVVGLMREEHRRADQIALVMLSSTVIGLLMSGRYHIYRAVLSGEGHALVSTFTRCMAELQQRGHQTEKQTQEAMQQLRDEIKKLG
jgi:DNA-binding helix-hairpin-helix protein with protein kinase domain